MNSKTWPAAAYEITKSDGTKTRVTVNGRERWALENLRKAGRKGCTPIDQPAPRWSAYIFDLRAAGVEIETLHEPHGGPFAGTHGRYLLKSRVVPVHEVAK